MTSYLDAIPQAVATIVSACVAQSGQHLNAGSRDAVDKWAVDLTDKLTRAFTKALGEAEADK
jgi:hypothetical protein